MSIYSKYAICFNLFKKNSKRAFTPSLENGVAQKCNQRLVPFFSAGFTITEMIVVIAIASAIIATIVVQQDDWNDNLALTTQSYEIVLMLRQAQIYSLGVKEYQGGTGDKFNIGYGIHLDTNGTPAERVVFFADKDSDRKYDSGEEIETKTLTRGIKIHRICATVLSPCTGNGPKQIDITFFRPETEANMVFFDNQGNVLSVNPPSFIRVKSPKDKEKVIRIESNGQISI